MPGNNVGWEVCESASSSDPDLPESKSSAASRTIGLFPEDPEGEMVTSSPRKLRASRNREFPPFRGRLIVVDRFELGMIDLPIAGSILFVRRISRGDALELIAQNPPEVMAQNERMLATIERELGLEPVPRAMVSPGQAVLVCHYVRWNEVLWYFVQYVSDGDGVTA